MLDRIRSIDRWVIANISKLHNPTLNTIMKFLAGVTIVISIPTMVASFMGMNVPLGGLMTNDYAFFILVGLSLILSLIVAYILKKKNML